MTYEEIRNLYNQEKDIAITIKLDINQGNISNKNQDRILLKNQLKAAKDRILEDHNKRDVAQILEYIEKAENDIHININDKGLVIFIAEDYFNFVTLPFAVGNQVRISDHFATRTLIRAYNQVEHYYILAVSQSEVNLIECYNDNLIKVFETPFPIKNETFYEADRLKRSFASSTDKLSQAFFRVADEAFSPIFKANPLPIILAGPEEAMANFEEISDEKRLIIGKIRGNHDSLNGPEINELIEKAHKIISDYKVSKANESLNDLEEAASKGLIEYDLNNIYNFSKLGQVGELVVDEDYYQEAVFDEDDNMFVDCEKDGTACNDIVNLIIHIVKQNGGEIVYVPSFTIHSKHRIAAILRWK